MRFNGADFEMNYHVDGPEGAPWVTLSNSLVCSTRMWDTQMAGLAKDYRVLRYDVRGHGESSTPPPPYSIDDLADDVLAIWDHLGIARSHWIGLSLGGMTGIRLADREPERVVTLTASDCRAEADETYAAMFVARAETTKEGGMEPLVEPTLQRFFTDDFRKARPDVVARYGEMIRRTTTDGHIGCCMALAGGRFADALPRLKMPTLFIGGRHDIGAPPHLMQAMHEAAPGSTHIVLEDAGHISLEEQPEEYAEALAEHLRKSD